MTIAISTQSVIEAISSTEPNTDVTQVVAESASITHPSAMASQVLIEIIASNDSPDPPGYGGGNGSVHRVDWLAGHYMIMRFC